MKISQICVVALLVVLASTLAFGDPIGDPKVIVKGANGDVPLGKCPQCVGVGFNFSFTIPAGGSGSLYFTNESGKNWSSLKLIETGVPAADVSCHSPLFASCKTETLKNGSVEILLSNAGGGQNWKDHGILNGQNFAIQFSCVGKSCWPGGLKVSGTGSSGMGTIPEPATLGLMATGLGALFSRRKRWLKKFAA
ncbi:MAG: PEP-CTERM sorting domain-containing protein [Terriglobales bacterium]|jgi:hypothetical protein